MAYWHALALHEHNMHILSDLDAVQVTVYSEFVLRRVLHTMLDSGVHACTHMPQWNNLCLHGGSAS